LECFERFLLYLFGLEAYLQGYLLGIAPFIGYTPNVTLSTLDPSTQLTVELDYQLSAYDYDLPPDRIAQTPVIPRDSSRLLVVEDRLRHQHRQFRDLPDLLCPGDLLVLNNTKVIPARLFGHKIGDHPGQGAKIEVLLLEEHGPNRWLTLVKPGRKLPPGVQIQFSPQSSVNAELRAEVLERDVATGGRVVQFQVENGRSLLEVIDAYGTMPLPPYIQARDSRPEQYQTVYASQLGSAAAPTAGLHFTPELLERLSQQGIQHTYITLHVGVGTFRPVEAANITHHTMHGEWINVSASVVEQIQRTQAQGGRVIAVGTTSVRSLEAAASLTGHLQPFCGKTELFIYPGYHWRVVDGLITNFHLPKSSLMMLVSAFIGRQRLLDLYEEAIAHHYRFYSFGDAMLILPAAKPEVLH
jgi:S-adenosylmethionine:tRNA ribosyltransferase-isomerase